MSPRKECEDTSREVYLSLNLIESGNKVGTYRKTGEYIEHHKLLTLIFSYCPIKQVRFYFEAIQCDSIMIYNIKKKT